MGAGLEKALLRAWTGRGALACALFPLSLLYRSLVALRWWLYHVGLKTSRRLPVPVVVVGNAIAGGAGKTPTVLALVAHWHTQGVQVGVVSRGYGRSGTECQEVLPDSAPHAVGDEPLLLRRKTGVPVFVGRDRHATASALLARYPSTQIIVCDDGLQHYALYRDVEVCVFDTRGTGNGWLLPAGPLREPWPRRALAAAGQDDTRLLVLKTGPSAIAGWLAQRALADHALDAQGRATPLNSLRAQGAAPLLAVAGIAQPEVFFSMLRAAGLPIAKTMAMPDHYDFDSFSRNIDGGYRLICTEKDAVKLWQSAPDALAVPLLQPLPADFYTHLDQCLRPLVPPLSSPHGHKTS
jgi:tetraacyldisaccharide 4'-kinase